jgi:amidase/aspartyl-tRNA(Asn)/glutamyl-tRNA(Gln) amidotransferase subunit A
VLLLEAMMGQDEEDAASQTKRSLGEFLKPTGLQGKRIGVLRNKMGYFAALDAVFEQQLATLKARGATLVDVEYGDLGKVREHEYQVLLSEFKYGVNKYFANSSAPVTSLQQAIALNKKNAAITMPIFDQEIFIMAQEAPAIDSEDYKQAQSEAKKIAQNAIDALLAQHKLAMLIAPTTAPAWKIDHLLGDHFVGSAGSMAAVAGYPHLTVPMGMVRDMPVNMSFIGGNGQEGVLIEAAYDFEQSTKARRAPALE